MTVRVYASEQELANEVAKEIISVIKEKPTAVICMASGNSPKLCSLEMFNVNFKVKNPSLFPGALNI